MKWEQIETAPRDRHVLIWSMESGCHVAYWRDGLGWCNDQVDQCSDYIEVEGVTHWMLLPEPPK